MGRLVETLRFVCEMPEKNEERARNSLTDFGCRREVEAKRK